MIAGFFRRPKQIKIRKGATSSRTFEEKFCTIEPTKYNAIFKIIKNSVQINDSKCFVIQIKMMNTLIKQREMNLLKNETYFNSSI